MPKDSLAIVALGKTDIVKIPRIKSYKVPDEKGTWLAYLLDKPLPETNRPRTPDSLTRINTMLSMADSLIRVADSIRNKANLAKSNGLSVLQPARTNRPAARPAAEPVEEGSELVLKNLLTGEERRFTLVKDYFFNKAGTVLLIETTRKNSDECI